MEANETPESIDRESRGIVLHASGATYEEIAQILGYADKSGAYRAVMRALKKRAKETNDLRDEMIAGELETTRLIIRGLIPAVVKDGNARSAEVLIKALERRANLMGWNAPTRVDHKITDQLTAEIAELVESMASLDAVEAANLLAEQRG